jgi:hypothetical protein
MDKLILKDNLIRGERPCYIAQSLPEYNISLGSLTNTQYILYRKCTLYSPGPLPGQQGSYSVEASLPGVKDIILAM